MNALNRPSGRPEELHINGICLDDELLWRLIQSNPRRVRLQNCNFDPNDSVGLDRILEFLNHENPPKLRFSFTVQFNIWKTRWDICNGSSDLEFNEQEPVSSLLLILSSNALQQISLDGISSLVLVPLKSDFDESQAYQLKENLKSIIGCQQPSLKRLLLKDIKFDGSIEDVISLSRLKLDLICLWRCDFKTSDPIWSSQCALWELANSAKTEKHRSLRFSIRTRGHTAQILDYRGSTSLMLNSPDLVHALILYAGQDLPGDQSLDDISLLALLSPMACATEPLSFQLKENMKSVMSRQYPNLKYLLLKDINIDDNIGDFIPISQSKLDLIYLWNCAFKTSDPIWSALVRSMRLTDSMHTGKTHSFRCAIPFNGHTIQIIISRSQDWLMPNSSDLIHELIISVGQNLPSDLSLDDISIITLLPSENVYIDSLSSQSKQNLKSIICQKCPKLRYLLLMEIAFNNSNIEEYIPILQPGLDLIYLWRCAFETTDPVCSLLLKSKNHINSKNTEKNHNFRFVIQSSICATQIIINDDLVFLMPDSQDLVHGLISPLGQNFPIGLSLDKISFLVFSPPEPDLGTTISSQFKKSLESIKEHLPRGQKILFLKSILYKENGKKAALIRELDLVPCFL
jgi:hypothetical protein